MPKSPADPAASAEMWRRTLTHGHIGVNLPRRLMRLLPGPPRCKSCNNPFGGFGGRVCRLVGMRPSRKNPRLCELCCEHMPPGGAEVETAIMFADVRGSTAISERLGPTGYADLLNRFYNTATEILIRRDATIDKLIGDEVMAFFVPGFAGADFKRVAVEAAMELRQALQRGPGQEPWIPVGIGVDVGVAFVGVVGGDDYVDFTALGDPVNSAARIQAAAATGELLVGDAAYEAVRERYPDAPRRLLNIKGRDTPIGVRSLAAAA
jgi:adenylate cyclase